MLVAVRLVLAFPAVQVVAVDLPPQGQAVQEIPQQQAHHKEIQVDQDMMAVVLTEFMVVVAVLVLRVKMEIQVLTAAMVLLGQMEILMLVVAVVPPINEEEALVAAVQVVVELQQAMVLQHHPQAVLGAAAAAVIWVIAR